MTTKAELEFRRTLSDAMKGSWDLTWHEDGRVNPGVPDLSFVMKGDGYETGWIELKAVFDTEPPFAWALEQSQHSWIMKHLGRIPIFILVASGDRCWLFDHRLHHEFRKPNGDVAWLDENCLATVDLAEPSKIRSTLAPRLRELTHRNR